MRQTILFAVFREIWYNEGEESITCTIGSTPFLKCRHGLVSTLFLFMFN